MRDPERRLEIPIVPTAWQRAGYSGRTKHFFTPKKTDHYETAIRLAWLERYGSMAPMEGPVRMHLTFIMPRPKSLIWKKRPMPRLPHDKRPDLSNLTKSIEDAMNHIAFADDGQLSFEVLRKRYAAGGEAPSITIELWKDEED